MWLFGSHRWFCEAFGPWRSSWPMRTNPGGLMISRRSTLLGTSKRWSSLAEFIYRPLGYVMWRQFCLPRGTLLENNWGPGVPAESNSKETWWLLLACGSCGGFVLTNWVELEVTGPNLHQFTLLLHLYNDFSGIWRHWTKEPWLHYCERKWRFWKSLKMLRCICQPVRDSSESFSWILFHTIFKFINMSHAAGR